jgi:hypothetical protein
MQRRAEGSSEVDYLALAEFVSQFGSAEAGDDDALLLAYGALHLLANVWTLHAVGRCDDHHAAGLVQCGEEITLPEDAGIQVLHIEPGGNAVLQEVEGQ